MSLIMINNLKKSYKISKTERIHAVNDVSFSIQKGEILGLVGESGCGKSVTAKSIMGLIKAPQGEIKENSEILYNGENILKYNKKQWHGAENSAQSQTRFNRPFAPQEGFVATPERPCRDEICLNGRWKFMPVETEGMTPEQLKTQTYPTAPVWDAVECKVPSPWNVAAEAATSSPIPVTRRLGSTCRPHGCKRRCRYPPAGTAAA